MKNSIASPLQTSASTHTFNEELDRLSAADERFDILCEDHGVERVAREAPANEEGPAAAEQLTHQQDAQEILPTP